MLDFDIQRCTRRCAKTDQELQPGEIFFSVLVPEGSEITRLDYSEAGWEGPPDQAIGFWRSEMPSPSAHKIHWAPNDVMLHYFEQLEANTEKEDVRYLLALLMIRRRVVRLEDSEHDDQGREVMLLYCGRNEKQYRATVVHPADERMVAVRNELAEMLYSNAS